MCYCNDITSLRWHLLGPFFVFIFCHIDITVGIYKGRLMSPTSFTALSGDLHVQLQLFNNETYLDENVQQTNFVVTRISKNDREEIHRIKLFPDPRRNVTQISIPCKYFVRGGNYELKVTTEDSQTTTNETNIDERLKQPLAVKWPTPKLILSPQVLETYPEEPVRVVVSFPDVQCELSKTNDLQTTLPEFWLELIYCGEEVVCNGANRTKSNVLYAEQILGYPKARVIFLQCQLFGLAGHYAVILRPTDPIPSFVTDVAYARSDWSDKFVFNVHARSIFPCDPHTGVGVLYEYPTCILDQSDRIRLFAKLRADVASLKPPTSLHYVTEQRVVKGQHSSYFDCELFSEKYVEYCFVYVTQAITGAVADIRMDCVPTLSVKDSDTGGWGPWSDWTPCSTTCSSGTRNRYRFCDSPPPRYGAKFCEGSAVETDQCGQQSNLESWDCIYSNAFERGNELINRPSIIEEIGPGCRCGCIVHLGSSKSKRMIASSTDSCPGKSFWLIQGDDNKNIRMTINFIRLPCTTQYLKVRDGDSVASNLLVENIGDSKHISTPIVSSGSKILIEFYTEKTNLREEVCNGGFLAHVEQIVPGNTTALLSSFSRVFFHKQSSARNFTLVHFTAVMFASLIIVISALLGAHYILRYRKYHLALSIHEPESPMDTPRTSVASFHPFPSRAMSTTTLLSEVIYLVKMRPKTRHKHSILRESIDADAITKETNINEKLANSERPISSISINTLTNEVASGCGISQSIRNEDSNDCESAVSEPSINNDGPTEGNYNIPPKSNMSQINIEEKLCETRRNSKVDYNEPECEDSDSVKLYCKRNTILSASNVTLTNGCYSPAASVISTATIRTTTPKESKDKKNREKLLARPGSEFSLANPEDFELDYYDYNVINAGAAPGSYLGMDPAYLVWIPPLDGGLIMDDIDGAKTPEPHYEEILPHFTNMDTGSNTESPVSGAPELPPMNFRQKSKRTVNKLVQNSKTSNLSNQIIPKRVLDHHTLQTPSNGNSDISDAQKNSTIEPSLEGSYTEKVDTAEKEILAVKSSSDLQEYYELDDIQFADEDSNNESDNSKSVHQSCTASV